MVASSSEFQTKILRRSVVPDEYKLYRAALEWDLTAPIVIETRKDLTSGASAANSAACLRISAASAVAQRVPVRRLVLELQATRRREILGRHRVPVRRLVLEQDGHVHRILVTRRADGARRVCGQAQHSLVAGQHLCDEAADAAPDGVLLQAGLQGRSNALSLPLR